MWTLSQMRAKNLLTSKFVYTTSFHLYSLTAGSADLLKMPQEVIFQSTKIKSLLSFQCFPFLCYTEVLVPNPKLCTTGTSSLLGRDGTSSLIMLKIGSSRLTSGCNISICFRYFLVYKLACFGSCTCMVV